MSTASPKAVGVYRSVEAGLSPAPTEPGTSAPEKADCLLLSWAASVIIKLMTTGSGSGAGEDLSTNPSCSE